jgi:hypothetical protein
MEKKKLACAIALKVIRYVSLVGKRQCYYIFNSNIAFEKLVYGNGLCVSYVTKFSLASPFKESVEPLPEVRRERILMREREAGFWFLPHKSDLRHPALI